jgi:hypothetical protein
LVTNLNRLSGHSSGLGKAAEAEEVAAETFIFNVSQTFSKKDFT